MRHLLLTFFISIFPVTVCAETVTVQLLWKHQFQFAGYYAAIEKGFYAEEGLDVVLKEYEFGTDIVDEVMNERSQFGVARTSLLVDKTNGADIIALLAAYQKSPLMLLTTDASGLVHPRQLENKRVMITNNAKKVGEIIAMLMQSGIQIEDFQQIKHSYNVKSLIEGEADAMASYVSNEPYQMSKLDAGYNIIHPKDFGFDMYSDLLFSSKSFVQENPDLTERFYRASIRGWIYAFENVHEIARLIHQKYNSQKRSLNALIFEGKELRKLAFDNQGNFGTLSEKKFSEMANVYLITNVIKPGYNFSDFIYRPPRNFHRLSETEQKYIKETKTVKACVDPSWPPYEMYSLQDGYQGLTADHFKLILNKVGLEYTIVPTQSWEESLRLTRQGKCDLLTAAMQTVERSDYLNFTRPYISIPAITAVRESDSANALEQGTIGVVAQNAFYNILMNRYPNIQLKTYKDPVSGLRAVQMGEIDGFVDAEAHLIHAIRTHKLHGLTMIDTIKDSWDLGVAISKDDAVLLNILNRSIESLSQEEKQSIFDNWLNTNQHSSTDYRLLWKILLFIGVIAVIGIYRFFKVLEDNHKLHEVVDIDSLTGVLSRSKLNAEMKQLTTLVNEQGWTLSLLFFDIDNFKHINDTYGHDAGDQVLVNVSQVIKENARHTDRFGRWGGEEFLIVMIETNQDRAAMIADKLRQAVESHPFPIPQAVTCSFGIAQYQNGEKVSQWIHRADMAMYEAKQRGKNQVFINQEN